jgi:hypothetical protein
MNHFGKQVETVTTQTLLIAGSEARGSAGRHERPLLSPRGDHAPKEKGKGQPIDKDWFDGFLKELTERFGGSTSFLRAPGQGLW